MKNVGRVKCRPCSGFFCDYVLDSMITTTTTTTTNKMVIS
jgi:hypothetical protein